MVGLPASRAPVLRRHGSSVRLMLEEQRAWNTRSSCEQRTWLEGYVAQPIGLPELRVAAASEAEAVAGMRQALERGLASAQLVHVSVTIEQAENPWLSGRAELSSSVVSTPWGFREGGSSLLKVVSWHVFGNICKL